MKPDDIDIRTELRPGDLGYVIYLHGKIYGKEQAFGVAFEAYVALGLHEFYEQYDPVKVRVWSCEQEGKIIGFLLLMHRSDDAAQLRYFILEPAYRGTGLGRRLMDLYMEHLRTAGYRTSYLWTTDEHLAAAALYKRHGFVQTESKASQAFGKPLYELKFELPIIPPHFASMPTS